MSVYIGLEFLKIAMIGKDRAWKGVPHSRSSAKELFSILERTNEVWLGGKLMGIPGSAVITVKMFKGRNATGYFTRAITVEVTIEQGETRNVTTDGVPMK